MSIALRRRVERLERALQAADEPMPDDDLGKFAWALMHLNHVSPKVRSQAFVAYLHGCRTPQIMFELEAEAFRRGISNKPPEPLKSVPPLPDKSTTLTRLEDESLRVGQAWDDPTQLLDDDPIQKLRRYPERW